MAASYGVRLERIAGRKANDGSRPRLPGIRARRARDERAAAAPADAGRPHRRAVINLASNNYLGLSNHPRMNRAAADAAERFGAGTGAVRTIAGQMRMHL